MMSLRFNYREVNAPAFRAMMSLEQHTAGRGSDKLLTELVKIRVSQLNGCAFCLDMHAKDLLKLGIIRINCCWSRYGARRRSLRIKRELCLSLPKLSHISVKPACPSMYMRRSGSISAKKNLLIGLWRSIRSIAGTG